MDDEKRQALPLSPFLPKDAILLRQTGAWAFYYSEERKALLIETNDYHAGPLTLGRQDLLDLLSALESRPEERRNAVIAELNTNPELLVHMELLIARYKMARRPGADGERI